MCRGGQTLLPRTVWQPETWGYSWNVRVMVEPGPWNEIEEIMKSWALQEQARGPWAWVHWVPGAQGWRPLVPEAWLEAQPASELHAASFVVSGLGKLLLESCRQQACCHLSVETLGARPGLWLGLPSSPQ